MAPPTSCIRLTRPVLGVLEKTRLVSSARDVPSGTNRGKNQADQHDRIWLDKRLRSSLLSGFAFSLAEGGDIAAFFGP